MAAVHESIGYDDTMAVPNNSYLGLARYLPIQEGQVIAGRYRVGRLLGAGGMGLVFEGQHIELRSPVAIKIIQPELATDSHILTRFVNEARGVAGLTSPHIARVFDAGRFESGEAYLVMERLQGKDLGALLKESGPLPIDTAVIYLLQACEGLSEAHATGLIHRDLKPEHLFIVEAPGASPIVKVLDFGISKRIGGSTTEGGRLTHPGDSMGSPSYMSPEQMQNPASVDARTDVWSLGVVLYQVLSGVRPFDGETIGQIQWQVIGEDPLPLHQLRSDVPPELEDIVQRCLQKQPAERFDSARAVATALRQFLTARGSLPEAPLPLVHLRAPALPDEPNVPSELPPSEDSEREVHPYGALLAADDALEPSAEELRAAGLPGRHSAVLWLVTVLLSLAAGAVLGIFLLGGVDNLRAWLHGLNAEPTLLDEAPSHPWEPALLPVRVTSGVTSGASSVAPETPSLSSSVPPAPLESSAPLATPIQSTESESIPRQMGKEHDASREGMTPEQIEARYRQWLERENLTPVDEVPLDPDHETSHDSK